MDLNDSLQAEVHVYDQDGLRSVQNHEFMGDPSFRKAYERGVRATEQDYQWLWRVHVGLWVAKCAGRVAGDFVECRVNRGFLSSGVMDYLDWGSLGKHVYLLDTFKGTTSVSLPPIGQGVRRGREKSRQPRERFLNQRNRRYPSKCFPVEESYSY